MIKKTIQLSLFLLYKYYYGSKNTRDIAYFNSILTLSICLTFNIICVFTLFGINLFDIIPSEVDYNFFIKKFGPGFLGVPALLVLFFFFREKEIKALIFTNEKMKKGNFYLVLYLILTFLFFVISVFARHHGYLISSCQKERKTLTANVFIKVSEKGNYRIPVTGVKVFVYRVESAFPKNNFIKCDEQVSDSLGFVNFVLDVGFKYSFDLSNNHDDESYSFEQRITENRIDTLYVDW